MKNQYSYFVLLLVILSSCSSKTYTALYQESDISVSNQTPYYLPKNLLQLEVIYTLNEPRVEKNGIDLPLNTSNTKITIEDPIQVTNLLAADTSRKFVITGKQLTNSQFINGNSVQKNTYKEETTTIPIQNNTTSTPSINLTDSSIEAEAYKSVLEILNNISKIKTKKDLEMTYNLVSFYKAQFKTLNNDFKPYIKKSKIKYTVVIDPAKLYTEEGKWSKLKDNQLYHTIYPSHIFEKNSVLLDTLKLTTPKLQELKIPTSSKEDLTEGIICLQSSSTLLTAKINNVKLDSKKLNIAQYGSIKRITKDDLKATNKSFPVLFKINNTERIINDIENIEPIEFNSSQTTTESQIAIEKAYKEKLQNINLFLEKLKERKATL